jgi:Zn-dependent oligopeptidase
MQYAWTTSGMIWEVIQRLGTELDKIKSSDPPPQLSNVIEQLERCLTMLRRVRERLHTSRTHSAEEKYKATEREKKVAEHGQKV